METEGRDLRKLQVLGRRKPSESLVVAVAVGAEERRREVVAAAAALLKVREAIENDEKLDSKQ